MPDETYSLTADVLATVTTYNNSVERLRGDDQFWNHYLSQMHDPPNQYLNQPNSSGNHAKDSYLKSKLSGQDLYNNFSLSVQANSFFLTNSSSWSFCFLPTNVENSDVTTRANTFRQQALLYHTRREKCTGTWRITYNSIELTRGACNKSPLPEDRQTLLTNATLALPQWYMTALSEYLGPFTDTERNNNHWLLPATCTIFAGVYRSCIAASNTMDPRGPTRTTDQAIQASPHNMSETIYHVFDTTISSRRTMDTSPLLYLTLAIHPVLITSLFVVAILLRTLPLDSGFGTVTLLAGVRVETLKLPKGVSLSGKLVKPIHVRIKAESGSTNTGSKTNG
ncbi:hypothetical protein ACLMJK_005707 [Lecanora helva]